MMRMSVRQLSVARLVLAVASVMAFAASVNASRVEADSIPEITRFLNEQIYYISEASKNGGLVELGQGERDLMGREYEFSGFWLRLQASVGFDVPGIATLSVLPTVELIWEKL